MTLFSWSWLVHLIPWRVYFWLRLTLCVPLSVPSFDAVTVLNEEYQRKTLLTKVCATGRFEIGCRKQQGRSREKTICWAARTFCGMGMYSPHFMETEKSSPLLSNPCGGRRQKPWFQTNLVSRVLSYPSGERTWERGWFLLTREETFELVFKKLESKWLISSG